MHGGQKSIKRSWRAYGDAPAAQAMQVHCFQCWEYSINEIYGMHGCRSLTLHLAWGSATDTMHGSPQLKFITSTLRLMWRPIAGPWRHALRWRCDRDVSMVTLRLGKALQCSFQRVAEFPNSTNFQYPALKQRRRLYRENSCEDSILTPEFIPLVHRKRPVWRWRQVLCASIDIDQSIDQCKGTSLTTLHIIERKLIALLSTHVIHLIDALVNHRNYSDIEWLLLWMKYL